MPKAYAPIPLPNRGGSGHYRGIRLQPAFATPVRWTLLVLSWIAFSVAGYLAIYSLNGASVPGCGVDAVNHCDTVLSSSWSKSFGLPVAVLGLAVYATLASLSILLWWRDETASRYVTTAFVLLAVAAAIASLWFIGLQIFAIHDYCQYCLVTDVCGILIGGVALGATIHGWLAERGKPHTAALNRGILGVRPTATAASAATMPKAAPPSLAIVLGGAVPLIALLIVGQTLFAAKTYEVQKVTLSDKIELNDSVFATPVADAPSTTDQKPELHADFSDNTTAGKSAANANPSTGDPATAPAANADSNSHERIVTFLDGKLSLNVYQHPIIGSPDAPHIVIEMISYDCPHCRKMFPMLKDVLSRYGDQVAILVMPIPLEKECNRLITSSDAATSHEGACWTSQAVCSIARIDPPSFEGFHDFIMTGKERPRMEKIMPKAYSYADSGRLRTMSHSPEIKKQIDGYIDLLEKLQKQSRNPKGFGLPVLILGDDVLSGEVDKPEDLYKSIEDNLGVKPK